MITVLTVGCGKNSFQPSVSSIYVHKDGRITEAIVESFIQDYYSFDEFQSMVEKEVAAYDNVSIKSLELKDSTVYLLLDFADAETYSKYSEVYCFQGTVEEALSAGLPFAMDFKDEQYEEYSTSEVTEKTSNPVLVDKIRQKGHGPHPRNRIQDVFRIDVITMFVDRKRHLSQNLCPPGNPMHFHINLISDTT